MAHQTARLKFTPDHSEFTNPTMVMDMAEAARLGKVSGAVLTTFQTAVTNVGATEKDMWQGPTDLPWLIAPAQLTLVSSSADDTDGGSGAHEVQIVGLDDTGVLNVANAVLNGTTPVTATDFAGDPSGDFLRIFKITVTQSGSDGEAMAVGNIDALIGGVLQDRTYPGRNTSYSGFLTLPVDTVGYIQSLSVRSEIGLEIDVQYRPLGGAFTSIHYQVTAAASTFERLPLRRLEPGGDLRIRARRGGGGSGDASLSMQMLFTVATEIAKVTIEDLLP